MSSELKFPLHFKCSRCKADAGILQLLTKREIAEGILPKDEPVATGRNTIMLADDVQIRSGKLVGKKVRVMVYYADLCSKCGGQYIYLVDMKEITMPAMPMVKGKGLDLIFPGDSKPPRDIRGNGGSGH